MRWRRPASRSAAPTPLRRSSIFSEPAARRRDRLDAIADDFGGPYDAVVAIAVLQHVPPEDLSRVLSKVAASLRPSGRFLVAVPLGHGSDWEVGESGHRYFRALWTEDEFVAALTTAGFEPDWTERSGDAPDSGWLTVMALLD